MRQLENGLSERTLAFEPGFEVHGEVVCRTFQPSYVVTRDWRVDCLLSGQVARRPRRRSEGDSDEQEQRLGRDVVASEGCFGSDHPLRGVCVSFRTRWTRARVRSVYG